MTSDELTRLRDQLRAMEQRIAELERDRAAVEAAEAPPAERSLSAPTPSVGDAEPTRRGLLRFAGAGMVGAAAAVVARPGAAAAAEVPIYASTANATSAETSIYVSPTQDTALGVYRDDFASTALLGRKSRAVHAIAHQSDGIGVDGNATEVDGIGIRGIALQGVGVRGVTQSMYAVHGVRLSTSGSSDGTAAVYGEHRNVTEFGTGVIGSHAGSGWGMWAKSKTGLGIRADGGTGTGAEGVSVGSRGQNYGVIGRITSTQPVFNCAAVRGATASTTNASYGVHGTHAGTGTAVYGETAKGVGVRGFGGTGRGGVFTGGTAQINLTAGALATHPAAGVRGDFYVDNTGGLWFCKTGGSSAVWAQIA